MRWKAYFAVAMVLLCGACPEDSKDDDDPSTAGTSGNAGRGGSGGNAAAGSAAGGKAGAGGAAGSEAGAGDAGSGGSGVYSAEVETLDPTQKHYDKNYAQWAAEWVEYVSAYRAPECADPVLDETGEYCQVNQSAESPVFFLVGNYGGVSVRTCSIPKGKALFFPLVNTWIDNAGFPPGMQWTDAEMRAALQTALAAFEPSRLFLRLDNRELPDLERGVVKASVFSLDFTAANNKTMCDGSYPSVGTFRGMVSGYWAMLPPLAAGEYTIEFGLKPSGTSNEEFAVEATYTLTVE